MPTLSSELTGIHPTRLELLRLRRRRTLAEGIIDILEKDLEALMTTLFELLKNIQQLRSHVFKALNEAYTLFIEAEMMMGSRKIEQVSLATQSTDFLLDVDTRSGVLGIPLPTIKLAEEKMEISLAPISLVDTTAKLDESSSRTWDALDLITKLAEAEASIREILDVISMKRRQVNRLQYRVLPDLDKAIRYIELILEETERQDTIRVRVLQRKRKERAMR
jgi:V/A-type H+-transporting ATPase subunit D